jgi:hypothetical protein
MYAAGCCKEGAAKATRLLVYAKSRLGMHSNTKTCRRDAVVVGYWANMLEAQCSRCFHLANSKFYKEYAFMLRNCCKLV